jgi:PKHD-type hydroxylase
MSIYNFSPTPTFGISDHAFVTWKDGFTNEEVDDLIKIGESLIPQPAKVGITNEEAPKELRVSKVSWLTFNKDTEIYYSKLAWIANQLNGQFYRYNISGFCEDFQYTVYDASDEGHYTWHMDKHIAYNGIISNSSPRKLSLIMQLSDPSEYEGGDIELFYENEPVKVEKEKGFICVFPSWIMHRVTPVTKGTRRSLVIWMSGPAFV